MARSSLAKKRKKPSFFKRLFRLFVLLAILCIGIAYFGYDYITKWADSPREIRKAVVVHFPSGTSLDELAGSLEASGLIDDALKFKAWVRLQDSYGRYQAGIYQFSGAITPNTIQDKIFSGVSYDPIVIQYVIPEGFTLQQVARRLEAQGIGSFSEIWSEAHKPAFLKELKIPAKNLEGFIYPATYSFTKKPKPQEALRHMVETFWQNLPENYLKRLEKKKTSLLDAVTFASLIEKETMHDDEREKVSEVIWSRLKNREPIAIDAAIIYGIKNYDGDIKWKHLRDRSNPYNTRIHKGLPPSPIGAVSKVSLEAVLNPTSAGYYYYVAKPGSNRHHFSLTLKEHNRHVQSLLKGK